jgi:hypothetical protein
MPRRNDITKILVILLLLQVSASANVCVQPKLKVKQVCGQVLDPSGIGIPGSEIGVWTKNSKVSSSKSDNSGRFCITGIKVGEYELRVEATGFQSGWSPIAVTNESSSMKCGKPIFVQLALGGTRCSLVTMSRKEIVKSTQEFEKETQIHATQK